MNEDEIRRLILDRLYTEYHSRPHNYVMRGTFLETQGMFGLDPKAIDRNIRYLQQKGLIDVKWFLGWEFMARLTAFGVYAVERTPAKTQPKANQVA